MYWFQVTISLVHVQERKAGRERGREGVTEWGDRASCGTASLIDLVLMSNSSLLWSAVHHLPTSDDHNVCGTDNHVGKCYLYSPFSNNEQCNIAFWLGCTLLSVNIDEIWQLRENMFMAITKQHFPKGVLPRNKVALGNCWN